MEENKKPVLYWPKKAMLVYWEAYGGWPALWRSSYLWTALVLAILCTVFRSPDFAWETLTISIIPGLLGFSLGAYVIMMGFGDVEFLEAIRGRTEKGPSLYMKTNATFTHFLVVEILTLLAAIVVSALGLSGGLISLLGMFLLLYTVALLFATVFSLLNVASWYDQKPKE